MYKRLKLTFTVIGDYEDLDVYANNEHLAVAHGKGKINASYSAGVLSLYFQISAPNGTDYKIVYVATVDKEPIFDTVKPSPIEDSIKKNGYRQEVIKIPV